MQFLDSTSPSVVVYAPIPGFPGYECGSDGSIWSRWVRGSKSHRMTDTRRQLKPTPMKHGHLTVNLSRDGKKFPRLVHRLVLEAFVGPCPLGQEACHDPDRDPSNNTLDNLRYDTHSANMRDSVRHGTHAGSRLGEDHPCAKLAEHQAERIVELRRAERIGATKICRRLGIPMTMWGAVHGIIQGRNWRHVTSSQIPI